MVYSTKESLKSLLNKLSVIGASVVGTLVGISCYIKGTSAGLSLLSAILAAMLFAILKELGSIYKSIESILNLPSVAIIEGHGKCISEIKDATKDVRRKVGDNIYLRRAISAEFSIVLELLSKSQSSKKMKEILEEYNEILKEIILKGYLESYFYDETIYGFHPRKDFRKITYSFIKDVYFKQTPNTSYLGFLKTLRNFGLILIGEGRSFGDPKKWYYGFLLIGDRFDKMLKTTDERIIEILNSLWESLKDDCYKYGLNIDFYEFENENKNEILEKIKNYLELE